MDPTKPNDPGNGSQGSDPPEGSDENKDKPPAPKFVTSEQLNQAITSRFKDFEKSRAKADEGLLSGIVSKVDEVISSKFATFQQHTAPAEEKKEKKGAPVEAPPLEEAPAYKALEKQVKDLTEQRKRDEDKRKIEHSRARELEMRTTANSVLQALGIAPDALDDARLVLAGKNRLKFDGEELGSRLMFRNDDGDEVPAEEGVKSWIESGAAKRYLPAKDISGSGAPPNGGSPGSKGGSGGSRKLTLQEHIARRQSGGS